LKKVHFAGKISKMGDKLLIVIPKKLHGEVRKLGEYVEVLITRYGEGPRPLPRLKREDGKLLCYYPATKFDEDEEPLVLNTQINERVLPYFSPNPREMIRVLLLFTVQALNKNEVEESKKLASMVMKLFHMCF